MTSIRNFDDIESQPLRTTTTQKATRSGKRIHSTSTCSDVGPPFYPRLIPRDLPFQQSKNRVHIRNYERNEIPLLPSAIKYVLSYNWFHILLRWNTLASLSFLVGLWFLLNVIFAYIYVVVDTRSPGTQCGLGQPINPISFSAAFAFSLETSTTVGYGLPNGSNNFFEPECRAVQIAITLEMISTMLFNAFLAAFLWVRFARCEQRGTQVVFGNKAIIEFKDGRWQFHVRLYDLDSRLPVVEAHVRFYCISWCNYDNQIKRSEQSQLTQIMRIVSPNDDLGATIFASIPLNVTHHIDVYSPLAPEHLKRSVNSSLNLFHANGLILREADQMCGYNSACYCPICGETYETFENLQRHIKFNRVLEDANPALPISGTHRDENILKQSVAERVQITKNDIRESLRGKEVLVLVEGIEPMMSGTFQAMHSYKIDDIVFDKCFAPCVSQIDGKAVVDLDRFHEVLPYGSKSTSYGYDSVSVSSSNDTTGRRTIFP